MALTSTTRVTTLFYTAVVIIVLFPIVIVTNLTFRDDAEFEGMEVRSAENLAEGEEETFAFRKEEESAFLFAD